MKKKFKYVKIGSDQKQTTNLRNKVVFLLKTDKIISRGICSYFAG